MDRPCTVTHFLEDGANMGIHSRSAIKVEAKELHALARQYYIPTLTNVNIRPRLVGSCSRYTKHRGFLLIELHTLFTRHHTDPVKETLRLNRVYISSFTNTIGPDPRAVIIISVQFFTTTNVINKLFN